MQQRLRAAAPRWINAGWPRGQQFAQVLTRLKTFAPGKSCGTGVAVPARQALEHARSDRTAVACCASRYFLAFRKRTLPMNTLAARGDHASLPTDKSCCNRGLSYQRRPRASGHRAQQVQAFAVMLTACGTVLGCCSQGYLWIELISAVSAEGGGPVRRRCGCNVIWPSKLNQLWLGAVFFSSPCVLRTKPAGTAQLWLDSGLHGWSWRLTRGGGTWWPRPARRASPCAWDSLPSLLPTRAGQPGSNPRCPVLLPPLRDAPGLEKPFEIRLPITAQKVIDCGSTRCSRRSGRCGGTDPSLAAQVVSWAFILSRRAGQDPLRWRMHGARAGLLIWFDHLLWVYILGKNLSCPGCARREYQLREQAFSAAA